MTLFLRPKGVTVTGEVCKSIYHHDDYARPNNIFLVRLNKVSYSMPYLLLQSILKELKFITNRMKMRDEEEDIIMDWKGWTTSDFRPVMLNHFIAKKYHLRFKCRTFK